ncbi:MULTISPECIES: hypothetical protein [unclassified Microbacterium]|uniref:hypothetical protein n=1 Tax=unclassified Microbacterium TaxID=2609290 RepID=UPI00374721DB
MTYPRLPVLISLIGAAILFLTTAAVFALVIYSIVTGNAVNFTDGHDIADAAARALP